MPWLLSSGCVFGLSSLTRSHNSRSLVQAAHHTLLGPAKAMKRPLVRATRTGNAGIMGDKNDPSTRSIHCLSGVSYLSISRRELIVVILIQTRFALSDVQEWSMEDRDFDMRTFYWNMVDILETSSGTEILVFLDLYVCYIICTVADTHRGIDRFSVLLPYPEAPLGQRRSALTPPLASWPRNAQNEPVPIPVVSD